MRSIRAWPKDYDMALLEIEQLQTHFRTQDGVNRAVDGISFHVNEGESLPWSARAVVGNP